MEQPNTPEEQPTPVPESQAAPPQTPARESPETGAPAPAEHQQAAQQQVPQQPAPQYQQQVPQHQPAPEQPQHPAPQPEQQVPQQPMHHQQPGTQYEQQAPQHQPAPEQPQQPAAQHGHTAQQPAQPASGNGQPPAQPPGPPSSGQDPKTMGTLAHGLVLVAGLANIIPAIGLLGFLAAIACIILFFVWRDKEPLIKDNFKQAAGFLIVTWLLGVILGVFGGVVSASVGLVGGWRVALFLVSALRWIRIGLGAVIVVFSAMGIMEAQKANVYKYPVIGDPVHNLNL